MKTEYKIVRECEDGAFNNSVNSLLQEGWELHGSVSIAVDNEDLYFAQALVRKVVREMKDEN